jgi:hypothetical protein
MLMKHILPDHKLFPRSVLVDICSIIIKIWVYQKLPLGLIYNAFITIAFQPDPEVSQVPISVSLVSIQLGGNAIQPVPLRGFMDMAKSAF